MRPILFSLLLCAVFGFHLPKEKADLIVIHARIYTIDEKFGVREAMAIRDGKILACGTSKNILEEYQSAEVLDAKGRIIYPGFIDAHAHFAGYAATLRTVDLTGTASWEECLQRIKAFVQQNHVAKGTWILGRGWDQNDWKITGFPTNELLNELYPDNPVVLERVDGHASIANAQALERAGIRAGDTIAGGEIEMRDGRLTGILIDNATERVSSRIPAPGFEEQRSGLQQAEKNLFAKGLTTVDDCGLDIMTVSLIRSMQDKHQLKLRLYAMLSDNPANLRFIEKNGPIKTDRLNVRSVKVYADGALGSRGACLLAPYADKPGHLGFLLSDPAHFDSVAAFLKKVNFQMCTHAIGDSGNRVILNTYARYLEPGNDRRWRIEHAQVISRPDFDQFGKYSIIPSVQPTHATSDMYWAEERLGKERLKGAYAYRELLRQNRWMPLGTDFPVEDIDPLKTFFAAVIRKDGKGYPKKGFQPENALSREEALRGMTIWAARSNFEESEKGSLEPGKFADFIIADTDLMHAKEEEILRTKVLMTYINGEKVFDIKQQK